MDIGTGIDASVGEGLAKRPWDIVLTHKEIYNRTYTTVQSNMCVEEHVHMRMYLRAWLHGHSTEECQACRSSNAHKIKGPLVGLDNALH